MRFAVESEFRWKNPPPLVRPRCRRCDLERSTTWGAGSRSAVDAARNYLFSQQHEEGYWCGELEADTTLESDYILLHTLLGTGNQERFDKAARYILNHQNEDGGWSIYAGGPSNISASVKAYFGLKLAGYHGGSSRTGARPQEDS